jgi:hypothetical protein
MAFVYDSSKYKANQLISVLIACSGLQFMSLGVGLWWFSIIMGVIMIPTYRKPELHNWQKELEVAVIEAQIANIVMGTGVYYATNVKALVIFAWFILTSLFPIRIMFRVNGRINSKRKEEAN